MSSNLLKSRKFLPLFVTQFLSAFNDNFLKNVLVFLILFQVASEQAGSLITLTGAIFMLPFLAFSALGGELADKHDKARMAEKLKLAELGASFVAVLGLWLASIPVLMAALFLFGVISALFGPIKYGILPDHLDRSDLPAANAYIEGATFIAILGGTIVGGLASAGGAGVTLFGPMMIGFATLCWLASRYIPNSGAGAPDLVIDWNIFRSTKDLLVELKADSRIWNASLIISWFWLVGAIILSLLPPIVKDMLGGAEVAVTSYLAIFAVAVGVGSAFAAWLTAGRVVMLPAPVGTFLMALFGLDLSWTLWGLDAMSPVEGLLAFFAMDNTWRVAVDLSGLAIAGSMLIVPSFAAVQTWAKADRRARVIAGVNVLNAAFMTVGGGAVAGLQAAGVSITHILFGLAIANIVAAVVMLKFLPTNPVRDFITILFRAFLRLEVEGREHLENAGDAPILALNHVSFLDGPLALALTDAEPIFAIDHTIAQAWWVRPFLKYCDFIGLDPSKPLGTRTLIKAVEKGQPLVIFPEGRITVTGGLMKVYDGAAMVADKTGSMVVPIRIEGLEKSFLSRLTSMHVRRRLFPKVKVTILKPEKLDVDPDLKGRKRRMAAGAELYKIMSELVFRTSHSDATIVQRVIKSANDLGMKRLAVEDPLTGKLSYSSLLTAASVLANRFKQDFKDEETIGLLLPNANGSIAVFLGLLSAGKVPAMMNFTAGTTNLRSACDAASIKTVLTSHSFIEQGKLEHVVRELSDKVRFVYADDLRETINWREKLIGAWGKAKIKAKRKADDAAVILFTSGSEGTPKGVVLTHRNILSNAAQAGARIDFHSGDKVFNALPIFHSFGLTTGTILPLISGVPVYFYPSPLHYRIIPELIYGTNATILFGTDTFLNGYARTAHPFDFRSIRYCFAGAEPVKASTREAFVDKFGLRILEGYGVTETAPVISINTPMYSKRGTVGKLMPGMDYRLEAVPGVDDGGRLFVKGDNVMAGYLRAENPGVLEQPEGGWHDTGDIVTIDSEGFITIRGRAKRFAKIAGEMVSLAAVEALADQLWPGSLTAIASLPDPRKGEKLIMLTDAKGADRQTFLSFAKSNGAMDIMIPAEVHVTDVPVLGSGKIDYVGVKQTALDILEAQPLAG